MNHRLLPALAGLAAALVLPAAAQAHAQLLRVSPADGAAVAQAPPSLQLAFSEPVVASRSTLDLYDSHGRHWRLPAGLAGATLTATVPPLADGGYRLVWRSLSADDLHAVGGEVVFGVGAAAPVPAVRAAAEPQPAAAETAIRWTALALLALLAGSLVLRLLGERPWPRLERAAGAGAVAATLVLLADQVRTAGSVAVVASSGAGRAAAALALGVVVALALAPRHPRGAAAAAALAAGGLALGAHATAFGPLETVILAVHLGAAAVWTGTVLAAAIAVRRGAAAGLLGRLAPVLVPAVAALAATGLLELGRHAATVDALLTTTYGRLVLLKSVLLVAAGALGLTTRRAIAAARAGRALRAVAAESALLVVALAAAAAMAAGAPAVGARFHAAAAPAPSVLETRQVDDVIVTVEVRPNRPGANFVAIRTIETRRPAPAPVTGVAVAMGGRALQAQRTADGTWQLAGVTLASGAVPLRVAVERPGLPLRADVDWVVGGAPPAAPAVVSRHALAPATSVLGLLVLVAAGLALAGSRRRVRAALALVLLGVFPASALGAVRDESVVVTLRGSAPSAARPADGVERTLRGNLDRRGTGLRRFLAGRARRVQPLWIAGGYAVTASPAVIAQLRRRPDVAAVRADRTDLRPLAEPNIDLLQAPAVWLHAGSGVLAGTGGAGVAVAVLDTGLDVDGPLAARFRGRPADWFDAYGSYPSPADAAGPCSGHGTAVAGVIAAGVDDAGLAAGVAPDAQLLAARIFDGSCRASETAVHAAFQWVLDPDSDPDTADAPAVVNVSWGASTAVCDATFQPDLAALAAAGIVVVAAAGNGTVPSTPATLAGALAVGALDASGAAARPESGRGASPCDGRAFPDLAAPGTDVRTTDRAGVWQTVSGTSIAAPHVTGLLALLLARHPGMTAAEQVAAVTGTAAPLGAPGTGAGRADALAAFESALPAPRDRTAPILTGLRATPAVAAGPAPVVLAGHVTDDVPGAAVTGAVASVTLAVDGKPATAVTVGTNGAIAAPVPLGGLADGLHTAVLSAVDDSGNVSRPRPIGFAVDRVPPVLDALALERDEDGRVVGAVTATDASTIMAAQTTAGTIAAADGLLDTAQETLVVRADGRGWRAGRHAIAVRVRDAAGNWSPWRSAAVDVPRVLRRDGFEEGLGSWRVEGRIGTARAAALVGRSGLDVRVTHRPAYLQDDAPVAERTLDVRLRLRVRRLRGTLRVLELAGATGPVAAVELRAGRIRLAGSHWVTLPRGTVRVAVALRAGRATLTVNGRRRAAVAAAGTVEALRLGAVRGGSAVVAVDAFEALRA